MGGHDKVVELLLKANSDVDRTNEVSISIMILKIILQQEGGTALLEAASSGYQKVVQLLLQANSNPNIVNKVSILFLFTFMQMNN